MHTSKQFNEVEVDVLDKSGFDLSHENIFSTTVGTLTPCLTEFMYPSDTFSVSTRYQVTLPPLATNFKGQVNAKVELFFVPCRILWAGWKDFVMQSYRRSTPIGVDEGDIPTQVPTVKVSGEPGSLADYLGFRTFSGGSRNNVISALPFAAYHKIWENYYRYAVTTKPFFNEGYGTGNQTGTIATSDLVNLPWKEATPASTFNGTSIGNNGEELDHLYQRCWLKDRFTTATPTPQFGTGSNVAVSVEADDDEISASFSISSLRAANSLQKFLERSNLGVGARAYYDFIKVHYGVTPSDSCLAGPVYIGQVTTPVYVNSVAQSNTLSTSSTDFDGEGETSGYSTYSYSSKNPFASSVGAQFGQALCNGNGELCKNFTATEFGYLMGIFSLVPTANYGTGSRKYLFIKNATDILYPEFAGVGDQPIYSYEISSNRNGSAIFGYNRYGSENMFHEDEVHGLFRDGENLQSFVNQRSFTTTVQINTDFVTIGKNAMNSVVAMDLEEEDAAFENVPVMVDMFWSIAALRRLPESPLPHL